MTERYDVIVIGAGVAGMTAADLAAQKGLKVALAEEAMFGGLIINVNHLSPAPENMAGSGGDLAAEMMTKAADAGVDILMEPVSALEALPSGDIRITTQDEVRHARSVIIATGARLRKLHVPGEDEFEHRGVSHCADCDGPMFRGEPVMVVGGGDSALQEAAVLAEFSPKVHLVHRRGSFSGRDAFIKTVTANPNIAVHFDTIVDAIEGDSAVNTVRLRGVTSGQTTSVPCKGFFAYVGLEPNTGFLSGIDKDGAHLRVNDRLETSLHNVYAIGAVRAGFGGELTHAIEDAGRVIEAVRTKFALA